MLFDGTFDVPLTKEKAGELAEPLEMVQWARTAARGSAVELIREFQKNVRDAYPIYGMGQQEAAAAKKKEILVAVRSLPQMPQHFPFFEEIYITPNKCIRG